MCANNLITNNMIQECNREEAQLARHMKEGIA